MGDGGPNPTATGADTANGGGGDAAAAAAAAPAASIGTGAGPGRACTPPSSHISRGRYRLCQHGAFSGVAVIVASFVPAECPKETAFSHRFRKAYTYPPLWNEILVHWTKT